MITNLEQWLKLSKSMNIPLNELNKKSAEVCKRAAEENLELINDQLSRFSSQLKRLGGIHKPEDFFTVQAEIVNENIAASIEASQKLSHLAMESMQEMGKLWSETTTTMTEKTVEKAQKFADKADRK